ncbi:hypothetical protein [Stutzerimonas nitrititolerans]|uniref:hypothetical protein n=1 Tax=Stutzerimonas nitrititolerans TaxID=2482751 RepID=UPI0028A633D8|nr:hypothetical protein [Stutzerimonas nitrititolerans]
MKNQGLMAALLLTATFSVQANDIDRAEAYDDAQTLGQCAGLLEFYSQFQAAKGNSASAENLHQKANGWRIASMGALTAAGWEESNILSTADSIYSGSLASWHSALEHDVSSLAGKLTDTLDSCLKINDKQESYRRLIKLKTLAPE